MIDRSFPYYLILCPYKLSYPARPYGCGTEAACDFFAVRIEIGNTGRVFMQGIFHPRIQYPKYCKGSLIKKKKKKVDG
jgi:hypothetical protein